VPTDHRYGIFESYAACYNDYEAWVLITGDWVKFPPGEVRMNVRPLSEGKVRDSFGKLPDLPPEAFTRELPVKTGA
jgi:hypothetical protein